MEIYNRTWPLVPNKVRADGGRELDRFRGVEHPADTPNGAEAWVGSLTRANGATPGKIPISATPRSFSPTGRGIFW